MRQRARRWLAARTTCRRTHYAAAPCAADTRPARSARVGLAAGVKEFTLPRLELDSGAVLAPAVLAYVTYGRLNEARTFAPHACCVRPRIS